MQVAADPFNCLGAFSDAGPEACGELNFMVKDYRRLTRAYKPPSLRGAATRPPYMHAGQFATLEEVVDHYARAPAAPAGESELHPLTLSERERAAADCVPEDALKLSRAKDIEREETPCRNISSRVITRPRV